MTLLERLRRDLSARPAIAFRDERDIPIEQERHAEAAVLIPVVDRPEPGVILTQRPDWLPRHAGQVAFPGGRRDPDDDDLIATALREAEEEIGLARHHVSVAGEGAAYFTVSGFEVVPVIGVIPPDIELVPNPGEVSEIFEVPLAFLLDPANAIEREGEWMGERRVYLDIPFEGRNIWGITAGIVHNLSRQLAWDFR